MDIIKHIIPLMCLLTIGNSIISIVEMFEYVKMHVELYIILVKQIVTWWGDIEDTEEIINFIQKIYLNYLESDEELRQNVTLIKELFIMNVNKSKELSTLIDKYLIPQDVEKKKNAEVSTPCKLRCEMLDKIPIEFWTTIKKVFEPCAGKGGFIIDIIDRFMNGLRELIPDEKERYKTIVEQCLYFSDINPTNIYICKLLIDPYNEYKLNYNEGNTLELDIKEVFNVDTFDAVIGNPPYQDKQICTGKRGGGDLLWNKFVINSINILKNNGYLLFVHPPGWRKPESEKSKFKGLFDIMTHTNQLIYLEIHDTKDGMKTFNAGTRYDWYLMEKTKCTKYTHIKGDDSILYKLDLRKWDFLPNSNFNIIEKLLAIDNEKRCSIIYGVSNYETRKKWVSSKKDTEYKYECIHSTPQSGVRYMYSSRNDNGHFGIPKVIFGDSGIYNSLIDNEGVYGMTQHSMGLQIDNNNEGIAIKKFIDSALFKRILIACCWSNFQIDWRLFTYFKKDFWRDFINNEPPQNI